MDVPVLIGAQVHKTFSPDNKPLHVVIYEGGVFAPAKAWIDALLVPSHIQAVFEAKLEIQALQLSKTGALMVGQHNGQKVYRWHAADDALEVWYHAWIGPDRRKQLGRFAAEKEADLASRYRALRQWGRTLAERTLAEELKARTGGDFKLPNAQPNGKVEEAIEKLTEALAGHAIPKLQDLDGRVGRIEAIVIRDPDEFVTVAEALRELNVDPDQVIFNSKNLQEGLGENLTRKGCARGGQKRSRFSGSSLTKVVNTWRRADVYRLTGLALGKRFDHLLGKSAAPLALAAPPQKELFT